MGVLSTCCPTIQPELTEQGHKLDRFGMPFHMLGRPPWGFELEYRLRETGMPHSNQVCEHLLDPNQDGDIVDISYLDIV